MAFTFGHTKTEWEKKQRELEREAAKNSEECPNGCYLFVVFPSHQGANLGEVGPEIVLSRRYLDSGRFIGIARKVFNYYFENKTEQACVVYYFPSKKDARVFLETSNLKQPDFPKCAGHCEAWVVDRSYVPEFEQGFNTFMISEIKLHNPNNVDQYRDEFCTPYSQLLQKCGAQPYVVQTRDCLGLRRFCKNPQHIVTIHLFRSPSSLEDCMYDPEFTRLKAVHNRMALEMCSVFTIEPRACP